MNIINIKTIFLIFGSFFMSAVLCEAAVLKEVSQGTDFGVGSDIRVDIVLDTQGKSINAIEGEIIFPKDILTLQNIEDGQSAVGLWVTNPHEVIGLLKNKIVFSGVIPNGYLGERGLITTLFFKANSVGSGSLTFNNTKVLSNDGTGTIVPLTLQTLTLSINTKKSPISAPLSNDITPPDLFNPTVAQGGPEFYNGKYFIIFNTHDSESGVDHYELLESKVGYSSEDLENLPETSWNRVSNPAVLSDQTLKSYIYVKVLDRSGNQRIAMIAPNSLNLSTEHDYSITIILSIILLLGAAFCAGYWCFRKRQRHIQNLS